MTSLARDAVKWLVAVSWILFPITANLESAFAGTQEKAAAANAEIWQTEVLVDIFEVRLEPDQVAQLDVKTLEDRAATIEALKASLEEHGATRLLCHIAQPVELKGEGAFKLSGDVPYEASSPNASSGRSKRNIEYQSVRCEIAIAGDWEAQDPTQGQVSLNVKLSVIDQNMTDIAEHPAAVFRKALQKLDAHITAGKPNVLLTVDASDAAGTACAYVTRIIFLRNAVATGAVEALPAETQWQTEADFSIFEVEFEPEMTSRLNIESLKRYAVTSEALLEQLEEYGTARLLFRAVQPVTLDSKSTFIHGASVPYVSGTTSSRKIVQYQDEGVNINIEGNWDVQNSRQGQIRLSLESSTSNESHIGISDGLRAPLFRYASLKFRSRISAGKPILLLSIDAVAPKEKVVAYMARIVFHRTPIDPNAEMESTADFIEDGRANARICIFEVELDQDDAPRLNVDALRNYADTVKILQQHLEQYGSARVISRIAQSVNLDEKVKLEHVSNHPIAVGSRSDETGRVVKQFNYKKAGTWVEMQGRLNPRDPHKGRIALTLTTKNHQLSSIKVSPDVFAPIFQDTRQEAKIPILDGKPLVTFSIHDTTSKKKLCAQIVRIEFLRAAS